MKNTTIWSDGTKLGLLFLLLLILSILNIPLVNLIALLALPLPAALFARRHGVRPGLGFVLAMTLVGLVSFNLAGPVIAFMFATVGLVLGEAERQRKSGIQVFLSVGLTYFLFVFLGYLLFAVTSEASVAQLIRGQLEEAQQMADLAGVPGLDQFSLTEQVQTVQAIIPIILVIVAATYAFLTFWFAGLMFRRLDIDHQRLPAFREWDFPRVFLVLYLIFLVLSFTGPEVGTPFFAVVQNAILLLGFILMLQGFSLVALVFHEKRVSMGLRIFSFIGLVLLSIIMPMIMRLVGSFDMILRLRERLGQ
ncbi:DUF2232 domain-containing protein [Shouchella shacheensis]|uniref:DUF2232 domain-containing protein n=1 Tax=Shouchella shacheensis TaxID=1649580 RepID=UPI0007403F5D|nr:DUF2232 domain-containing protein [Shouchella shacheensis]